MLRHIYDDVNISYPTTAFHLEGKPDWVSQRLTTWHGIYGPLYGFRKDFPDTRPEGVKEFAAFVRSYTATIKSIDENLPIIMVSCLGDPKLVVAALKQGASDYVQKPVDNDELLQKIDRALELRWDTSFEKELVGEGLLIGKSFQAKKLIRIQKGS